MDCLWCDQAIVVNVSWVNLFIPSKPERLCPKCRQGLQVLHGKQCKICSRMTRQEICNECKKRKGINEQDPLIANVSVYTYNKQMQAMIAQWKYRGDYILIEAFKEAFLHKFNESFPKPKKDMVIVPIPLSKERLYERGFNQAQLLADFLPVEQVEVITRIHSEKQSKKTRDQRVFSENPFKIKKKINKPVIIVDDIYTTGTTLRHVASLLKEQGCPEVYAYTLVRG